ncbi:hypothetical protein BDW22DRAFT_1424354 [Trametopsis cervina]|nr:hypothetical protein BDW22DRAFT_1424354 [Trametopsis cervina]
MNNGATVALNNHLQSTDRLAALVWAESTSGPAHAPVWTVVCKIDNVEMGSGTGAQKHVAKDAAAAQALRALGVWP